jgi:arylsulfatase A-like enzyme
VLTDAIDVPDRAQPSRAQPSSERVRVDHLNGYASISEASTGFPGYSSHIPPENGTLAHVLRDAGWSTFWVGKDHNVPIDAFSMAASKKEWPLGLGYDRFYGFIGGETNQWYPDLAEDNHYVDQPYGPEDGYHLSKDLADKAIAYIRDSKQSEPDKPWYLWFCPGPTTPPTTRPRTTSTGTRAASTTVTRPTASGSCPA